MSALLPRDLLAWYRAQRRDLPWRRSRDPYRIWVSEIMLQQTRVEAVVPFYERWLVRFPTVEALAEAEPDAVLKAWEGLGYYSRARNLHQAAREVVARYGGEVPADQGALAALPGIGPYTVGAILSIAYGQPVPAVDGNVLRVLSRLFGIADDVADPANRRSFADLARALIPPDAAGDFNQALMELGARVCLPGAPRCPQCSVARHCRALAEGRTDTLPVRSRKAPPQPVAVAAAVVTAGGRVVIARRPARGLLAGLWEFPSLEVAADTAPAAALAAALWTRLGLAVTVGAPLVRLEHTFTHRHWQLTAYACAPAAGSPGAEGVASGHGQGCEFRWVTAAEVSGFALPAVFQKVAAAL